MTVEISRFLNLLRSGAGVEEQAEKILLTYRHAEATKLASTTPVLKQPDPNSATGSPKDVSLMAEKDASLSTGRASTFHKDEAA